MSTAALGSTHSLKAFCTSVETVFGPEYLRDPTAEELKRFEGAFSRAGFPAVLGCWNLQDFQWAMVCPKALQGTHKGKEGKPVLRPETICNLDLFVWRFMFGFPGMLNDLNILDFSPHFAGMPLGNPLP